MKTTYVGRVVYDRPKHLWTVKDLQRIIKRNDGSGQYGPMGKFLRMIFVVILDDMLALLPLTPAQQLFAHDAVMLFYDNIIGFVQQAEQTREQIRSIASQK
jgi:hypothetical protein